MSGGGKTPAAQTLQDLLAENYFVAQTPVGEPFAVALGAPNVMIRMNGSGGLRQRLLTDYVTRTGTVPPAQSLADVLAFAEAMAHRGRVTTPHLRIAPHAGAVYLDLGRRDGQAVEISMSGWRVVQRPPVLFARTPMTGELPLPAESGSMDEARSLLNIAGADQWALYVACRVASLIPGITHPVELLTGQPGSAKTSATRITSGWIDPSPVMVPVPRDGRSWATMAASAYVVPVDNVSSIPSWWSDLLCKAASGDGWIDRALYTDGDVYLSAFQSVIVINGIDLGVVRGDLADRSVVHELIRPGRYFTDDDVSAMWQTAHPAALAWLLDRSVEIMRDMAHWPVAGTDRLARFEHVVSSVDRLWRTNATGCWRDGKLSMYEDVADGDAVAVAIRSVIKGRWEGTSADLLTLLEYSGSLTLPQPGRSWTPRLLSERVTRMTGALRSLGWTVERLRDTGHSRSRKIILIPPGQGNLAETNGHRKLPAGN